jgi:hypothetical protein
VSTTYNFLEYLKGHLPSSAQWVFETSDFIGDFSAFVSACKSTFIDVIAVSDGSFKDMHGTASWRISLRQSTSYLLVSAIVPGPPSCQSAYRSELMGLYGICLSLWGIQQFFGCTISVEIGCDGLSAISSCQNGLDVLNPNTSHFDLISATRHFVRQLRGNVQWRHIKGHQDEDPLSVLDIWAQHNIQMDTAAKDYWSRTCHIELQSRPNKVFGEVGILWLNNEKIVVNLKQQVLKFLGSHEMIPHWEKRFGWETGSGARINWSMIGAAHSLVKRSRRIWAVKAASGWCGVGTMMVRWNFSADASCPRCQQLDEDMTHVLKCSQFEATQKWNGHITALSHWLAQHSTSPSVAILLCQRLHQWRNNSAYSLPPSNLTPTFRDVFSDQDVLGWECFMYGFWSIHWESIQSAYLLSIKSKITIKRWITALIRKLWDIAWDMWDHRNQLLHHRDTGQLVVTLNLNIEAQYQLDNSQLTRKDRRLFKVSLPTLLHKSVEYKQVWLQQVLQARDLAVRRARDGEAQYSRERQVMRRWFTPTQHNH